MPREDIPEKLTEIGAEALSGLSSGHLSLAYRRDVARAVISAVSEPNLVRWLESEMWDELEARCRTAQEERDAARAQADALADALESIRFRYFPVDEEDRVAWAIQTFEIAKAAVDVYRSSQESSDAS